MNDRENSKRSWKCPQYVPDFGKSPGNDDFDDFRGQLANNSRGVMSGDPFPGIFPD